MSTPRKRHMWTPRADDSSMGDVCRLCRATRYTNGQRTRYGFRLAGSPRFHERDRAPECRPGAYVDPSVVGS